MPKAEVSGRSSPPLDRARDAGLDTLFTVRPDGFVAARAALADSLKKAGDKEAAAAVRSLGKPTLPVWVVNQVARQQRATVAQLLEVSAQLRAAQQGQAGDLRALSERHRELLRQLRGHAARVLELPPSGSSSHLDRTQATLLAAASGSEEQQRALEAGELREEVAAAGFSVFGGFGPDEGTGEARGKATSAPGKTSPTGPSAAVTRAGGGKPTAAATRIGGGKPTAAATRPGGSKASARSVQQARAAERKAQQEARTAEREAQQEARRAAEAREALDRAEREAAAAARALQTAEAAAATAEQTYQEARAQREETAAALKTASTEHQRALRQVERLSRDRDSNKPRR